MLSKEASSIIFWVFGMTRPGTEPRSPGPLANTLTARPMSGISLCLCLTYTHTHTHTHNHPSVQTYTHTHIYIYMCVCVCVLADRIWGRPEDSFLTAITPKYMWGWYFFFLDYFTYPWSAPYKWWVLNK